MSRKKNENITYKQAFNSKELFDYIKTIGTPICVFIIGMFVIAQFGLFGTNLLAPMAGGMWIIGAFVAFMLPSQRESICKETHIAVVSYLGGMLGIRLIISLVAGTSNAQMMASYSQVLPSASGSTIEGFLQTMLWITSVMVPLGFVTMQGKKLFTFKKRMNKQKTIDNLRGLRDVNQSHYDYDG